MLTRVLILTLLTVSLAVTSEDQNSSNKEKLTQDALKKAMEKEKKYAKEQKFYNADQYDFKSVEVDPATLNDIEPVEPDYNHTDDWGACDND